MKNVDLKTEADFNAVKAEYESYAKVFFWLVFSFHTFIFCLFWYLDIQSGALGDFFARSGALNTAILLLIDFLLLQINAKAKVSALKGGEWGGRIAVDVIFKFIESIKLKSAVFISLDTLVWGFGDKLF